VGFRPWLWGLLPDNAKVLERWSRQFQVSARSPFDLLGSPIGHDCAGAVQFVRDDRLADLLEGSGHVDWLSEDGVADRIRLLKEDSTSWLGDGNPGPFSLAGAQAKTALRFQDGRWGVPHGPIPTTHILKPAIPGLDDQELNEHLCLAGARNAGLVAARSAIWTFGDQVAIVVERYDRVPPAYFDRVHQEDLCQALGYPPERKYESEGGPRARQIVDLLRRVVAPSVAEREIWRFASALGWNWIIGGTDAHAKNFSLLLSGPQVRLAPLYDLSSALPYYHEKESRFAMSLAGDYRVWIRVNRWPEVAKLIGLDGERLCDLLRNLAERAPDALRDAAAHPQVASLGRALTARLVDRIATRSRRCLAALHAKVSR